jgi:hypothetical protein
MECLYRARLRRSSAEQQKALSGSGLTGWASDMKNRIKTAADILMTAALPVLMCYSLVGETAHEVIGIIMFCLFIAHHFLNFGWIKNLFKGKYTLRRSVGTAVNALVFLCMIGLMYSSIVISKHVLTFVNIDGAGKARTIHLLCAYWGLVLMSVHLGMHISQIAMRLKLKDKLRKVLTVTFAFISAVGIYEFIKLKFADYLFGRVQFVFIDSSASVLLRILQYLSVMILFAECGYWLSKLISLKKRNDNNQL